MTAELEALRDEKLYVDVERLKGGDFFNDGLARAVYESATMILIYQPNHFGINHPYCACECRAMCELEGERIANLLDVQERNHGLIIPVIYRGSESFLLTFATDGSITTSAPSPW